MGVRRRFMAIMAVCFAVLAVVSLWRVAACGGREIWYVPLVLVCAAAAMAVGARRERRKKEPN